MMNDLVLISNGLIWLASLLGIYLGTFKLMHQYYNHLFQMCNFPKTYLIRYMIIPKQEITAEDSESENDQASDSELESDQNSFNVGPEFLRVTFITCSPLEVVKKIKHAIQYDSKREIFQLVAFEELC
jgi:hypothetical protein